MIPILQEASLPSILLLLTLITWKVSEVYVRLYNTRCLNSPIIGKGVVLPYAYNLTLDLLKVGRGTSFSKLVLLMILTDAQVSTANEMELFCNIKST